MNTNFYTVPSYYKDFVCKGHDCRHCCCIGWDVTISMKEYFYLQGMNCPKKLRKLLDKTFYVLNHPTTERYAKVAKNMDNDCPLHMSNGYCMLQAECGENALPLICRYYPRGPRFDYKYECSCSNSCEKVLELLYSNNDVLSFEELPLSFNLELSKTNISEEKKKLYQDVRNLCETIISNREHNLSYRLILLGKVLQKMQRYLDEKETIKVEEILVEDLQNELTITKDLESTLNLQDKTLTFFNDLSISLKPYASKALEYYHTGKLSEQYLTAKEHLKTLFPNQEIMFEKTIHNYLFYEQFPFSKQLNSLWEEFESLCGVYLFIKYLVIGYMADKTELTDFIDVMSAAFRYINHTNFNRNIDILLVEENITTLDQLADLIST